MNYESAELAKISINMYLVSMVTVTNILSEICEKIDADWEDIKPALKLDKRLGKYAYLSSGLGISGGNLERDLKTISKIGISTNSNVKVIDEFINHSRYRKSWLINILNKVINDFDNPSICVLGLTYKEKTHSVKNSPSIQILENFNKFRINTHDPEAIIKLPKNIYRKKTIKEAIKGSNILLVCTPWQQYFHLSIDEIKRLMSGNIIIDPYRVFDGKLAR